MINFAQIPRDANGQLVGSFRLRHRDSSFSESLAGVRFVDGLSDGPLPLPVIERMAAAMGNLLDLVAYDEVQDETAEATQAERATDVVSPAKRVETEKPRRSQAQSKASLPSDRDALFAIAEAAGVRVHPDWGIRKLKKALEGKC